MFAAKCDNCKEEFYEGSEYSCTGSEDIVREELMESDWHTDEPESEKHYCCNCWWIDDEDLVHIDKTRFKL